jgi:hypothetical protein
MDKIEELKINIETYISKKLDGGRVRLKQIAHDIVEDFISQSVGINEALVNENLILQGKIEEYKEIIKHFNKMIEDVK